MGFTEILTIIFIVLKLLGGYHLGMVGMPAPGDYRRCSLRCYRSGTVGGNL